jgi:adsorption protein B
MWSVDVFATYLYGLKLIAISLAIIILISGIDDLVIDRRLLGAAASGAG